MGFQKCSVLKNQSTFKSRFAALNEVVRVLAIARARTPAAWKDAPGLHDDYDGIRNLTLSQLKSMDWKLNKDSVNGHFLKIGAILRPLRVVCILLPTGAEI